MSTMQRIMVFDRLGACVGEIDPTRVLEATMTEEVNGEHSLTITTLQELEQTNRLLLRDGMGVWHEFVVLGIVSERPQGEAVAREYYCVWSLQYDLTGTYINDQFGCGVVPGHASVPQTPRRALECALAGTSRWQIGTITVTTMASASFYRRTGWEGLQTVIERWGGEIQATIEVSLGGVVTRSVDLLEHVGRSDAVRRFDYGHDLAKIKQTVQDEVWPCRIVPLGKSMETDAGGYTRRPGIESVNGGVEWLQDNEVAPLVRIPDGSGGWEYPTAIVTNDTYEQPADLLAWAQEHIGEYTRPRVTYEAEVAQFAQAGLDPHGVALGDEVVCVDRSFGASGLRITARVVKVERDLLDTARVELTIGNAQTTLAGQLSSIAGAVGQLSSQVASGSDWQASAAYMDAILTRLNNEINATGGYTYITEGEGLRTYDRPVSDPLVGAEATKVVEVKGGTIRIADSRTSSGDWDWTNVFTADGINSQLVRAVQVEAGYIGDLAGSGNFWDLDTGEFRLASTATVGDRTVQDVLDDVDATITSVDVQYAQNQSATTAPTSGWSTTAPAWRDGWYIWQRTATTTPEGVDYSTPVMISGRDGSNGVGISSTEVSYGTSASASTQPSSWSTTAPTSIAAGTWLWVRNVTTYTDGSSRTAYAKAYQGENGADGATGNGISSTTISYGTSASAATQPSSWSTTAPTSIAKGEWLWVRTVTAYTDGTSKTAYSKSYQGEDGTDGSNGNGIGSVAIRYGTSASAATQPSSWSSSAPTSIAAGTWLWTRTVTSYTDGTSTTAYSKSYVGTNGEDGTSVTIKGSYNTYADLIVAHPTGSDGDSYMVGADLYVWNGSAWEDVGQIQGPAGADGINGTNGTDGTDGSQIWTATANPTTPNYTFAIANLTGPTGVTPRVGDIVVRSYYRYTITSVGATTVLTGTRTSIRGAAGTSVTVTSIEYGTSSNATTEPTSWSTTAPTALAKGSWLWVRTTYSDGGNATTKSYVGTDGEDGASIYVQSATKTGGVTTVVIADTDGHTNTLTIDDGADGATGTPGTNGLNGYVHVAWATSADGSQGFSTTVSTGKTYLGTYTNNVAADSQDYRDYSWSLIKGADGTDGKSVYVQSATKTGGVTTVVLSDGTTQTTLTIDDGADGARGLPGANGTDGTSSYMHIAWANSQDGTQDFSTTVSAGKSFLGVYTDEQEDDSTNPADYSWSRIEGPAGEDGVGIASIVEQYYLSTSSSTQSGGSWVTTPPAYVAGRYYWTRSVITWDDGTVTITSAVLSRGLNSANSTATQAKSEAEAAQAQLDVLDTQQGVFNKLTNNGALQGLYMQDGQLFINGTYLQSGIVKAEFIESDVLDCARVKSTVTYRSRGQTKTATIILDMAKYDGTSTIVGHPYARIYNQDFEDGQIFIYPSEGSSYASTITTKAETLNLYSNSVNPTGGTSFHSSNGYARLSLGDGIARLDGYKGTYNNYLIVDGTVNYTGSTSGSAQVKAYGILESTVLRAQRLVTTVSKSRAAKTDHYGERLLYSYETPSPIFGDLGSGTLDETGVCVVEIDDIFAETVRTDRPYQVFLQKCGDGDLWVEEKEPAYFVVRGTPGLPFDWEVKARQAGLEYERLDPTDLQAAEGSFWDRKIADAEEPYAFEENYAGEIQRLYTEEEA